MLKILDFFKSSGYIVCLRLGDKIIYQNDCSTNECHQETKLDCKARCLLLLEQDTNLQVADNYFLQLKNQEIQGDRYLIYRMMNGDVQGQIMDDIKCPVICC